MAGVHEDFGEKIGGAKKDLWKDRGLYADDLEAMNEREAEKFVKKDNVWKKPDYAAMLEEGIPLGVVYFIKKARDGLNASPQYYRTDDTPEKRTARQKEYIKTVRELQTVLSDVRTVEDAMRAYDRFFVDNGYLEKVQGWVSGIHYRATKKGQDNPVITNKLSNTMLIRSAEYFERNFTQKAKKEQFCVSKEQKIPKGYAIHFNDGKHISSVFRKRHRRRNRQRRRKRVWIANRRKHPSWNLLRMNYRRRQRIKSSPMQDGRRNGLHKKQSRRKIVYLPGRNCAWRRFPTRRPEKPKNT